MAAAKRVLIVSEHPYPEHATLRRNVVQLLNEGIDVDLICLAGTQLQVGQRVDRSGLRARRMHMEHKRTGVSRYLFEYLAFFFWALPIAYALSIRHRYSAVLIDNLPDFLVFTSLVARWRGARIVLEMFELTPELTAARLRLNHTHPMLRWVRWIERMATGWADHLIVVSKQCGDILVERGVDASRISVLPNTQPVTVQPPGSTSVPTQPRFLVTHCSLIERYGVQVAIHALALLRRDWPDLRLRVLGDGEYKPALIQLAQDLGLDDRVVFRNFVPWSEAMAEIRQAELGIVAIIADGYGELLLPTKLLEYVEHDVPVVCARLPTIAHHFPPDSVSYFDPGDAAGLAEQADRLLRRRDEAEQQARRARHAMRALTWENLAPRYMAALGLLSGSPAAGVAV